MAISSTPLNNAITYSTRTLSVADGDSVYFRVAVSGENATQQNGFTSHTRAGTVTIRTNNASGGVIDTFDFNGSYSDTWSNTGPGGPITEV